MAASTRTWRTYFVVAMAAVLLPGIALGQDAPGEANRSPFALSTWDGAALAGATTLSLQPGAGETTEERTDVVVKEESTDSPFSFDLSYAVYSDYVFRGVNRSEYGWEGREKLNHQFDASVTVDIGVLVGEASGTCGIFTFGGWFEWFGAQKQLDPLRGGQNWQEVEYYLLWSYDLEDIASKLSVGYTFYSFPNHKPRNTQEWSVTIEHNDAWMWEWMWPDNTEGVLNPTFAFYQDTARGGANSMWMELGLSHEFEVAENLAITPSWTLGIDHDWYRGVEGITAHKNTFRLGNMLWGVDVTYDLAGVMPLPDGFGSMAVSGFLYFSDALGNAEDNRLIQDEFYGGMSIGWSF